MNAVKYLKGECQACGGHIEFPAEAIGESIDCPHCHQVTELLLPAPRQEPAIPLTTLVWTAVTVSLLFLGLAGALVALKKAEKKVAQQKIEQGNSKKADEPPTDNSPPPAADDPLAKIGFSASEVILQKNPGSSLVYAVGTLNNKSARQRFGVKLYLELFDAAEQKIGVATDYQQVIEPHATWNFRALVVDSKTALAKISSIKEEQ